MNNSCAIKDKSEVLNEVYLGTRSIVGVENKTRKIPINADNQHNKIVKSRYNLNILGFMLPKW